MACGKAKDAPKREQKRDIYKSTKQDRCIKISIHPPLWRIHYFFSPLIIIVMKRTINIGNSISTLGISKRRTLNRNFGQMKSRSAHLKHFPRHNTRRYRNRGLHALESLNLGPLALACTSVARSFRRRSG